MLGRFRRFSMSPPRMAAKPMLSGKAGLDQAPPRLGYVPPTNKTGASEQVLAQKMPQVAESYAPSKGGAAEQAMQQLAQRAAQSKTYTPSSPKPVDVPQNKIPDNASVVPAIPPRSSFAPSASALPTSAPPVSTPPVSTPMKKGGAIDLSKCKVTTAKKNKSSLKW